MWRWTQWSRGFDARVFRVWVRGGVTSVSCASPPWAHLGYGKVFGLSEDSAWACASYAVQTYSYVACQGFPNAMLPRDLSLSCTNRLLHVRLERELSVDRGSSETKTSTTILLNTCLTKISPRRVPRKCLLMFLQLVFIRVYVLFTLFMFIYLMQSSNIKIKNDDFEKMKVEYPHQRPAKQLDFIFLHNFIRF